MPTQKPTKKIIVPAEILADIKRMIDDAPTNAKEMPPEVLACIKVARESGLSWRQVPKLLKLHYPDWALAASNLMNRNRKEGWGL